MFFLRYRRTLNLLSLAVVALAVAFVFWGRPVVGISALVVAVFVVVATLSVFIASRDKVTTMSLLPVWIAKPAEVGKQ